MFTKIDEKVTTYSVGIKDYMFDIVETNDDFMLWVYRKNGDKKHAWFGHAKEVMGKETGITHEKFLEEVYNDIIYALYEYQKWEDGVDEYLFELENMEEE